ncbi:MAG: UDP-3-O-(3-hydroxymyristoyl)glucosamine N-acyltransferase [Sneathiella sp.]|nr:MAG: UDP-3-O-(3-hydroxymyristoyl)glucosamine N-acyltransferase [Sneathiella sp.]
MPDFRFFNRQGPFSLRDLAKLPDVKLADTVDLDILISDVKPLDQAGAGDLTFLSNPKYVEAFRKTQATACIATEKALKDVPDGVVILLSADPYKAYARIANKFYLPELGQGNIHPTAVIAPTVTLGHNVSVGAYAVIEEGVVIGDNTIVGPQCFLNRNVQLGKDSRLGAHVTLSHCLVGDNVSIYTGAKIGQDGFGFAPDAAGHIKIPQLGRVVIGSSVEIGANTTIDRGAGPDTLIGDGTWIDNLVQIGHNVRVGKGCIIVSQTGISGSTTLEDFVVIGGQVGLAGHLTIGAGAQVSAKSGVMTNIPAGEIYAGMPARPRRQFFRQVAVLSKLSKSKGSLS